MYRPQYDDVGEVVAIEKGGKFENVDDDDDRGLSEVPIFNLNGIITDEKNRSNLKLRHRMIDEIETVL